MATNILSDLPALTNPFGTPSQGQWNLQRGVFIQNSSPKKSVVFFYEEKDPSPTQKTAIDQLSDSGGRRLAVFEYPYVDGQKISDLGRKGEAFTFNIKFHGLNYQQLFNTFVETVVNYNGQATIIHPVRGALIVRFKDYEFMHRYDEWNAVTIKAVFIEDNTGAINTLAPQTASQDSALRSALQFLVSTQAAISLGITEISAALLIPNAISSSMQNRLTSITGQTSRLLGQLAATFSTNTQLQELTAQSANIVGGVSDLSSGTTSDGTQLPPVYQVGFDPTTQESIDAQTDQFVNANQITPQQSVFNANQARESISVAIAEIERNFGNSGYDLMVQYRGLAVSIQQATESAIASTQSLVKIFIVPSPMSLRMVAQLSGLSFDKQNDIEKLNPYLGSVNYIPTGTRITVPAA